MLDFYKDAIRIGWSEFCEYKDEIKKNYENNILKSGRYRHYKGKEYEVIGIARHSETLEEMVIYQALYGERQVWVRPLKMFLEEVEIEGGKVPRFSFVE